MNWSTTPPTKPGFYLWRYDSKSGGYPIEVMEDGWCSSPATGDGGPVATRGGQWLRLVPAEEVEKLQKRNDDLTAAIKQFVHRCEIGEIRSRKTYAEFCDLLDVGRAKQIAEGTL